MKIPICPKCKVLGCKHAAAIDKTLKMLAQAHAPVPPPWFIDVMAKALDAGPPFVFMPPKMGLSAFKAFADKVEYKATMTYASTLKPLSEVIDEELASLEQYFVDWIAKDRAERLQLAERN